jgi:glycosyltransferase involved in cell wall biosynthesis
VVIPPGLGAAGGLAPGPGVAAGGLAAPGVAVPEGVVVPEGVAGSVAPYILALGTVEPRKDLPNLVRAFDLVAAHQADVELRIAGPAGWAEDDLRRAVDGATHRRRIHRLGWVSDRERERLLEGAAVFVYPSVYEGFGFPPLEAMAAGVPVVATAAGAVPEVVGDAALLVPVGDPEALAAGLEQALTDDDERRRLIAAGSIRVAHYSWERAGAALAQLYQEVAGAR